MIVQNCKILIQTAPHKVMIENRLRNFKDEGPYFNFQKDFRAHIFKISVRKISQILSVIFTIKLVSVNFCNLSLHLLMFNLFLSKI